MDILDARACVKAAMLMLSTVAVLATACNADAQREWVPAPGMVATAAAASPTRENTSAAVAVVGEPTATAVPVPRAQPPIPAAAPFSPDCQVPETVACLATRTPSGWLILAPYDDIYATINLANVAYFQAIRSPEEPMAAPYWTDEALQVVRAFLKDLRGENARQLARLVEIRLIDADFDPTPASYAQTARVHTLEHWVVTTMWSDSAQVSLGDVWADNQYYLRRTGNNGPYVIYRSVVTEVSAPP